MRTVTELIVILYCAWCCQGVSVSDQLRHIQWVRNGDYRKSTYPYINARRLTHVYDPREVGEILGAPSRPEHLPPAEPILPGHTLIRPSLGMLKSAVKFPHSPYGAGTAGAAIYGNDNNLGLAYGRNQRVLYSTFRKNMPLNNQYVLPRSIQARKTNSPIILYDTRRLSHVYDPREIGDILGAPSRPEHLPPAEPILPGHTLIRPALGMLKSAVKFPHSSYGVGTAGAAIYGNDHNLGLAYGRNSRVLYSTFRRSEPEKYQLILDDSSQTPTKTEQIVIDLDNERDAQKLLNVAEDEPKVTNLNERDSYSPIVLTFNDGRSDNDLTGYSRNDRGSDPTSLLLKLEDNLATDNLNIEKILHAQKQRKKKYRISPIYLSPEKVEVIKGYKDPKRVKKERYTPIYINLDNQRYEILDSGLRTKPKKNSVEAFVLENLLPHKEKRIFKSKNNGHLYSRSFIDNKKGHKKLEELRRKYVYLDLDKILPPMLENSEERSGRTKLQNRKNSKAIPIQTTPKAVLELLTVTELPEEVQNETAVKKTKKEWFWESQNMFDNIKYHDEDAPDISDFRDMVEATKPKKQWWFFHQEDFQPFKSIN